MLRPLDQSIFTFAQRIYKLVEVVEVRVADCLFDLLHPLVSIFGRLKVVDPPLIGENEHERMQHSSIFVILFSLALDEDAGQALHVFMFLIALVLV